MHDQVVAGPLSASNKPRAKGLVSEAALAALSDHSSPFALRKICTCRKEYMKEDKEGAEKNVAGDKEVSLRDVRERKLDLETTDGCALTGALRLAEDEVQDFVVIDWQEDGTPTADGNETMDEHEVDNMLAPTTTTTFGGDYEGLPSLSQSSAYEVEQLVFEEMEVD